MTAAAMLRDAVSGAFYRRAECKHCRGRKDIPAPSQGDTYALLPTLTSVKLMLYQGMRGQGVGKAELARRLGWHQ